MTHCYHRKDCGPFSDDCREHFSGLAEFVVLRAGEHGRRGLEHVAVIPRFPGVLPPATVASRTSRARQALAALSWFSFHDLEARTRVADREIDVTRFTPGRA
jgi:hypothetical protein